MRIPRLAIALILAAAAGPLAASPVGSAFTYQGQLNVSGQPASAAYDLQFKLYDAAAGGAQIGGTLTSANTTVTRGLFTSTLDFGAGSLNGDARWLEIGVRPAGQAAAYTVLAPRQPLTGTPYALGLSLPLSESQSSAGTLLSLVNPGAGGAVSAVSSGGTALYGQTSTGTGVFGYNLSSGNAGFFRTELASNPGAALVAQSNGVGAAIQGTSSAGPAALLDISSPSNGSSVIAATTAGAGRAGTFLNTNAGNPSIALYGSTNGAGAALAGIASGTGRAGFFQVTNSGSTSEAVLIQHGGAGDALYLYKTSSASGSALSLQAATPTATAINVITGAIRCQGAGINTSTFAFLHQTSASEIGSRISVINNPQCNGKPSAMLFLTPVIPAFQSGAPKNDFYIEYNSSTSRWQIVTGSDMNFTATWNVMVVNN